jgi:multiple sugar transport system permease protein
MSIATASGSTSFLYRRRLRLVAAGILLVNGLFPALWILFTLLKKDAQSGSVWSPTGLGRGIKG